MRVWIITVGEPLPTDEGSPRLLRSGALAKYLVERGHDVTWFNSRFDHTHKRMRTELPRSMEHEGVRIELLDAIGYKRNVSVARVRDQAVAARDFSRRVSSMARPDVILCSLPTLELCDAATNLQQSLGVPVLLDIRDKWPDVYYRAAPAALRPLLRTALFSQERMANRTLTRATGIIGISPGYLQWALDRVGRRAGKHDHMLPLGYEFKPLTAPETAEAERSITRLGIPTDRPIAWYVGTFGQQYDLAPVIRAARQFEGQPDSPTFVLSGVGDNEARWKAMAAGLSNIVFTGWITRPEIGWLRQHASIGLQPYVTGAPQGLANKTFEYLSAGLPIVSSLSGENGDLLDEVEAGLIYSNTDDSCYRAISTMLADETLRKRFAANALATYQERFSSAAIFGGLMKALQDAAETSAESCLS
jgi:glycosyltransferase involved in cell wall biosynthesis